MSYTLTPSMNQPSLSLHEAFLVNDRVEGYFGVYNLYLVVDIKEIRGFESRITPIGHSSTKLRPFPRSFRSPLHDAFYVHDGV